MSTTTGRMEYKVISGHKEEFENKMNEISKEGFMWSGSMCTSGIGEGIIYSQLMSKFI